MGAAAGTLAQESGATERPQETELSLDSALGAEQPTAESEAPESKPWAALTENLRFNVDVLSRLDLTRLRGQPGGTQAVGLDIHRVFSDSRGDIGTLILQPYMTRYDNAFPVPHDAEDDDDWEFVFHNFSFNLTRWGRGRTNFRIGHFDVPYGLEVNTDTHTTVHQLISHENIGMDMDWGCSFNGTTSRLEYEVALMQGTGHEYINAGKNLAVAGRIGTPYDRNLAVGVSALHGQIIDPHGLARWRSALEPPSRVDIARGRRKWANTGDDNLVRRTRVGVDLTWIVRQFTLKAEPSVGRDYNQDVFNGLVELGWTSHDERLWVYLQNIYLGQRGGFGWEEDVVIRLGAVWKFAHQWALEGQYSQDVTTYGTRPEDALFSLQIRYRF